MERDFYNGLNGKALRNFDQWVVKKRIGAKMFMVAIKLNPLHSLYLMSQAVLIYSLRRRIKILAFPLKPCPDKLFVGFYLR